MLSFKALPPLGHLFQMALKVSDPSGDARTVSLTSERFLGVV